MIFKNKILNLIKANKDRFILIIINVDELLPEDDLDLMEEKENNQKALDFIGKLESNLDDEEKKFLSAMYIICEKSDNKLIAQASRNLEISNSKGWDIFRRIQRKAKKLCDEFNERHNEGSISYLKIDNYEDAVSDVSIVNIELFENHLIVNRNINYKYSLNYFNIENYMPSFTEDQLKKLSVLYKVTDSLYNDDKKIISPLKKFFYKIKKWFK